MTQKRIHHLHCKCGHIVHDLRPCEYDKAKNRFRLCSCCEMHRCKKDKDENKVTFCGTRTLVIT